MFLSNVLYNDAVWISYTDPINLPRITVSHQGNFTHMAHSTIVVYSCFKGYSEYIKIGGLFMRKTVQQGDISIHMEYIPSTNPEAVDTLVLIHALGLDMNSWDLAI